MGLTLSVVAIGYGLHQLFCIGQVPVLVKIQGTINGHAGPQHPFRMQGFQVNLTGEHFSGIQAVLVDEVGSPALGLQILAEQIKQGVKADRLVTDTVAVPAPTTGCAAHAGLGPVGYPGPALTVQGHGRRRALESKGKMPEFQVGQVKAVIFLEPDPRRQQCLWIMHLDAARAQDTHCFESLGTEHSAKPALAGGVTGIVNEAGHAAQVLSGRPHSQHRRSLGGGIPVRR